LRAPSGVDLLREKSALAKQLPMHGMAAYELLKTATDIFLLWNCGVRNTNSRRVAKSCYDG
jgi:hypothetical protein